MKAIGLLILWTCLVGTVFANDKVSDQEWRKLPSAELKSLVAKLTTIEEAYFLLEKPTSEHQIDAQSFWSQYKLSASKRLVFVSEPPDDLSGKNLPRKIKAIYLFDHTNKGSKIIWKFFPEHSGSGKFRDDQLDFPMTQTPES